MIIKTVDEIKDICVSLRKNKIKIVTTNGAFDLFHYGHLKSLEFAKKQGDILIVGINSDASVKRYKGEKRPIICQEQRARIINALSCVDYVIIFDEDTPEKVLDAIKPDVHVKGSEHVGKIPEKEIVGKNNGKLILYKRDKNDISTSQIIDKIQKTYGENK